MSKRHVRTFSREFPSYHPKAGQPTYFVEKIWKSLYDTLPSGYNTMGEYQDRHDNHFHPMGAGLTNIHQYQPKHHTIRAGKHFKTGDIIDMRVWSGKPYRSKQIKIAADIQVKVWDVEINNRFGRASFEVVIDGKIFGQLHYGNDLDKNAPGLELLSRNDGLQLYDMVEWFNKLPFSGQIICWNPNIEY